MSRTVFRRGGKGEGYFRSSVETKRNGTVIGGTWDQKIASVVTVMRRGGMWSEPFLPLRWETKEPGDVDRFRIIKPKCSHAPWEELCRNGFFYFLFCPRLKCCAVV